MNLLLSAEGGGAGLSPAAVKASAMVRDDTASATEACGSRTPQRALSHVPSHGRRTAARGRRRTPLLPLPEAPTRDPAGLPGARPRRGGTGAPARARTTGPAPRRRRTCACSREPLAGRAHPLWVELARGACGRGFLFPSERRFSLMGSKGPASPAQLICDLFSARHHSL